jgi:hypothetical protein
MAPSYANIFMGKLEKQLLESSIERPLSWYRFIDDVDMKWTQSDEELQNFLSRANNLHPSIKFTHEISNTTISFLDTSSSLSEGVLSTDLYSKPTDTNQYPLPNSCHPPRVTKSIPYSQALRIRRIFSTDKSLKKRLGQLKNNLKRRGNKQSIIKNSFNKANNIYRSRLLQYKEKQKCKRTPCVLTYHPCLRNSFNTIRGHWISVEKNSKLSKVFPEPPMVAFKQPNSLRNLLVRAEMAKPNTTIGKSHSCGDKRCKCSKHMQHSSSYTSKVTGKQYKIFYTVNCKSANVIYILECSVCGLQYVGESKQPFHKRPNGHRNDLTKKTFLPVSQHSRLSDHSLEDFNRMKIIIIEQNCLWSDFQRENGERFWIKELRVLHPDGINRKQQVFMYIFFHSVYS